MNILVPIKRVVDHNVRIYVKSDESGIETENVKMSINPYDENALTEAVRIRESGKANTVIAVSIGDKKAREQLGTALAMGADRAILIETDNNIEPLFIAKHLKSLAIAEQISLIITGKLSIDDDSCQTGQMLAALLGWPQGTDASEIEITENGNLIITRETDDGQEVLEITQPAVITADLRLNIPEKPGLKSIIQAKKKTIEVVTACEISNSVKQRLETLKVTEPAITRECKIFSNAEELMVRLKNEGVL